MIGISRILPAALLLAGTLGHAAGDDDKSMSVDLAGVAVVRGTIPAEDSPGFKPFGMERGTRLALIFKRPAGKLICFDEAASRIDRFTDDLGENLLEISSRLQKTGFLPYGCGITAKGAAAYVEIVGGKPPSDGATKVMAQGVAVFRVGSQTAELHSSLIPMEQGATVLVGEKGKANYSFTIARWKTGGAAGKGAKLTLLYRGDCRVFHQFHVFDVDGKPLESHEAGVNRQTKGTQNETSFHFLLDTVPEKLVLRVSYWEDMQTLKVPFKVAAGIGG